MAFRKIHDSFWADPEIENWSPDMRYFYLYCITNPQQTATGVMTYSLKRIGFEVGYDKSAVEALVQMLADIDRVIVDDETKELYVSKFYKYNKSSTKNHIKHLENAISKIKSDNIRDQVIADVLAEGTEIENVTPIVRKEPSIKKPNIPFEDIWKRYGVGNDKYQAEVYWLKMSDKDRQDAYDGLDDFLKANPDPNYRSYLIRYLRNRKWILDDFSKESKTIEPNTEDIEVKELYG